MGTADSKVNIWVKLLGGKEAERGMRNLGETTKRTFNIVKGFLVGGTLAAVARGFGELAERGAKIQGVERAFRRTGASLEELRKATRGTISEFELMQKTVMAKNLMGSIDQLPVLLKFATIRARELGVEADYLAESIVTGIGRKQVLILDNLGLSAAKIAEEVKKTGDFVQAVTNILNRDLAAMNENIAPAADEFDSIGASLSTIVDKMGVLVSTTTQQSGLAKATGDFFALWAIKLDVATKGLQDQFAGINWEQRRLINSAEDWAKSLNEGKNNTDDIIDGYEKWRADQEVVRIEAEKIAKWQERYNEELFLTSQLRQQIIGEGIAQPALDLLGGKSEEEIEQIWNTITQGYIDMGNAMRSAGGDIDPLIDTTLEYADVIQSVAGKFESAWSQAILNTWNETDSFFNNMAAAFEAMLASMVATLTSRAAIFGILSIFTGGGAADLLGVKNFGEYLFGNFQHGGSFDVGGRGGTDSQLVAFKASPGERVTVQTPEQQESSGINIHFHGSITSSEMIQREIIPQIKKAVRLGQA